MKRIYVEYTPIRRGLTGREFLGQYIDENFPDTKYYDICSNGLIHYGYIESESNNFLDVLCFCENEFAMKRLFVDEFRGAVKLYWIQPIDFDDTTSSYTITQLFTDNDVTLPTDILSDVKAYKIKQLKEFTKKQFSDYNDLVANLTKQILLLVEYKDDLTTEQTTRLNTALATIESLYDPETCLQALEDDITKLGSLMPSYYTIKQSISSALTIDDVNNIDLLGE